MNAIRKIAKNSCVLLISQIISTGLGFFFVMYMAQYLGAEGFGVISFALAFTGIFGILVDLGLKTLTTREVARNKLLAGKYLGNVTGMNLILALITFCLIVLSINILNYPAQTVKVVYVIALYVIINAFTQNFYSIFQANEKMEYQSLGHSLNSILLLVGTLCIINKGYDVFTFAVLYFYVSFIILIFNFTLCFWKFTKLKIEFDLKFWKQTIKQSLPFGLTSIFTVIYYYIDSIMISIMVPNSNEVVGWYNAAFRLVFVLLLIPTIYVTAIFPIMSTLYNTSKYSLKLLYEKSIKYMIFLGLPIITGVTLLSEKLIILIYGFDFIPSIIALKILIWSFLFASLGAVFGYLFNSINKPIMLTKIVGIGALCNVALNFLFIPLYSYIGASFATDLSRLFIIVIEFILLSKIGFDLEKGFLLNISIKSVISSLIMSGIIISLYSVNIILVIFISSVSYFVSLIVFNGFDKDDSQIVRKILNIA